MTSHVHMWVNKKKNSLQQMQTLSLCVDEKCIYLYKKKKRAGREQSTIVESGYVHWLLLPEWTPTSVTRVIVSYTHTHAHTHARQTPDSRNQRHKNLAQADVLHTHTRRCLALFFLSTGLVFSPTSCVDFTEW